MTSSVRVSALEGVDVLIADSNQYMRRLTRTLLTNAGIKQIYEAADGPAALDVIRTNGPDVMLLDWDLPVLDGPKMMRIVRAPDTFLQSGLPVIMLTDCALASRVQAALRLGVHGLLVKPISSKMLEERLTDIVLNPRPMVQIGKYYVPQPRRMPERAAASAPAAEADCPQPG